MTISKKKRDEIKKQILIRDCYYNVALTAIRYGTLSDVQKAIIKREYPEGLTPEMTMSQVNSYKEFLATIGKDHEKWEIEQSKNLKPQGDKPTDNPEKYGLKFDGGKARWDLVPMNILNIIISMPGNAISLGNSSELIRHNEDELYNQTLATVAEHKSGGGIKALAIAGFNIFRLLKGKGYTEEEIIRVPMNGAPRWDLFDIKDINGVVEVYSYGAKLYTSNNWKNVNQERYYSAFFRHFKTFKTKERFDSESGLLHLYHALWNIIALMWFEEQK